MGKLDLGKQFPYPDSNVACWKVHNLSSFDDFPSYKPPLIEEFPIVSHDFPIKTIH